MAASNLQEEPPPSFVAGLFIPDYADDSATLLSNARADGYDFCVTSLVLPSAVSQNSHLSAAVRKDVCRLGSSWWSTSIVGTLLMYDTKHALSVAEEDNIERMVKWACHMSIPAIILPLAANIDARLITKLSLIATVSNIQLWVRVRLCWSDIEKMDLLLRRCASGSGGNNVGICLDLLGSNPNSANARIANGLNTYSVTEILQMLHVLIGMNLKAVSLNTNTFMTNKRGYPTLSKPMQNGFTYILKRLGRTIRVLVEGAPLHSPTQNSGMPLPAGSTVLTGKSGLLPYLQYLRHLRQRPEVTSLIDTAEANMESSYLDHLQSPLQPLGDDLEFATYETFEKDPVKYAQYELAIRKALVVLTTEKKLSMVNSNIHDKTQPSLRATIAVLGAGRGPLVTSALNAVETINSTSRYGPIDVNVIALDKNGNAVVYLQSLLASHENASSGVLSQTGARWSSKNVKIIHCDMRNASSHPVIVQWQRDIVMGIGHKIDIIVSELLGSFGDNELSPECLEGAFETMNKMDLLHNHCISIPQSYISFLSPVSSVRLHAEAKAQAYSTPSSALDGPMGQPIGILKAMETPYVVRSHAASQTHREKPVFQFEHTNFGGQNKTSISYLKNPQFNKRNIIGFTLADTIHSYEYGSGYGRMTDNSSKNVPSTSSALTTIGTTIHGLIGTFEAKLFGDVMISIAPASFSVGMFSWFPLYFPIKEPLFVPPGASIAALMWRRLDSESGRVWYEWGVDVVSPKGDSMSDTVIACSPVHNPGGRSHHVRL